MNRVAVLLGLVMTAIACDGGPAGPTPAGSPSNPHTGAFAQPFTQIYVDELVRTRVHAEDPACVDNPVWRCKYFRITPASDGTLDVVLAFNGGNLDLSLIDSDGHRWWHPVSAPVRAGVTYQITVWEYEFTGLDYDMRASLRPL